MSNPDESRRSERPSLLGSSVFSSSRDLTQNQLPMETPYFTPVATWSEPRTDYFSNASSFHGGSASNPSQANRFGISVPAQTPAADEIASFAASSPSYFPSPSERADHGQLQEPTGFHLPPTPHAGPGSMPPVSHFRPGAPPTHSGVPGNAHPWEAILGRNSGPVTAVGVPFNNPMDRNGSMAAGASIPAHRSNLSISLPLSSLMSPPSSRPSPLHPSMSSLSQSHHAPVPTAIPAELNITETDSDAVALLLSQALGTTNGDGSVQALGTEGSSNGVSDMETDLNENSILLLDMRTSAQHAASSIKGAVSVSVPNMLLKRPMFTLKMVTEQLTTEQDATTFARWQLFTNIVFFDGPGTVPAVGSPTYFVTQKFRKEGCGANIRYLIGGINDFEAKYKHLCRGPLDMPNGPASPIGAGRSMSSPAILSSMPMSLNLTAPIPGAGSGLGAGRQRLHLGTLPSILTQPPAGPLGCQTPMIENPIVNPLFESVRQAMGLSTNITEEIPVRLPKDFTAEVIREHLPSWLLNAVAENTGKSRLAEYFQKVEISEQKRLALLMLPQNMRSGRTSQFSIGAGIEKGLKNRYNNVWPYDHTRVKIGEPDEDSDDYINASFLKPLLSRKTYIATQGPLPSTFQDFWKVIWEQDSRVVVMLTREQEMGRVKCHQYWPSAKSPEMLVGTMELRFIREFMPDPTPSGTITIRQMTLRHTGKAEPGQERTITQIQYTGWPDFGVPETPLEVLKVIRFANEYNHCHDTSSTTAAGPMIVHCSAGCGRTGAFCVIDSVLTEYSESPESTLLAGGAGASRQRLSLSLQPSLEFNRSGNDRVTNAMASRHASESTAGAGAGAQAGGATASGPSAGSEDPMSDIVFASVSLLREQRLSMVQTLRQYVFCYEAIFWHLAMEMAKSRPDLIVLAPFMVNGGEGHDGDGGDNGGPGYNLSARNAPLTTTNEEMSYFG